MEGTAVHPHADGAPHPAWLQSAGACEQAQMSADGTFQRMFM